MYYSLLYIYACMLLFANSLKNKGPKLCINCKYFLENGENKAYSKCELFQKIEENTSYLVDGEAQEITKDHHYCRVARVVDSMCGKDGKRYKKLYKRKYFKKYLYDDYIGDVAIYKLK